jgi:hypothetical protein
MSAASTKYSRSRRPVSRSSGIHATNTELSAAVTKEPRHVASRFSAWHTERIDSGTWL